MDVGILQGNFDPQKAEECRQLVLESTAVFRELLAFSGSIYTRCSILHQPMQDLCTCDGYIIRWGLINRHY